ncbi:MAG: restriction endonuclease subunit R [Deltaproteobacteria bacterium]|nr:restriction endonuclease subunit R [Deltaproteobacteria bacterium]
MDNRIRNLILDVRSNERIGTFDEATTKQAIVLRLLSELGWPVFNTEEVKPEYSVSNRRVDYALRINNSNKVFLEVKKVAEDLEGHQKQLLDYSFQEGVRLAVLTNGVTWWFYLPLSEGSWEQRKYFAIDLNQQPPEDTAKRFIDFLSRENITTEKAISVAETLLKGRVKENEINKNLPRAWNKIISEPDELLVDLINETLEKICGYRAEPEKIVSFINENVKGSTNISENGSKKTVNEIPTKNRDHITQKSTKTSRSLPPNETACKFVYKGTQFNGIIKNRQLVVEKFGKFASFSAASVEVTKTSRNGWRDWEIKLPGETQWQLADTWRKKQH